MVASLIDRRLWSNLLQLISGCVGAVIGAVYVSPAPPLPNWVAAIIGAVFGFVAAVFVIGALLAFLPAARTHRSVTRTVYLRLVRQDAIMFSLFIVAAGLSVVLFIVLPQWMDRRDAMGFVIVVFFIPRVLVTITGCRLEDIGCPSGGNRFGLHNPFKPSEHLCANCHHPFVDPEPNALS